MKGIVRLHAGAGLIGFLAAGFFVWTEYDATAKLSDGFADAPATYSPMTDVREGLTFPDEVAPDFPPAPSPVPDLAVPAPIIDTRPAEAADLLVQAIVDIESGRDPHRTGSRGERGLMQIRREAWQETTRAHFGKSVGFDRAYNPHWNLLVGRAYLTSLQDALRRRRAEWRAPERDLLVACYNAGLDRVARAGFRFDRLPRTTQDYVRRIGNQHEQLLRDREIPSTAALAVNL
jgi:hypothetical protein